MKIKYPLANSPIDKDDISYLIKWLETNPRLTMGPITKQFENKWANYIGTKSSVFVNSGSSANTLMVYASIINGNLSIGDKVIVPCQDSGEVPTDVKNCPDRASTSSRSAEAPKVAKQEVEKEEGKEEKVKEESKEEDKEKSA